MSDAVQDTFRSLLDERGGIQNFDETQRVIALRLSELLVSDASVNASSVVQLLSLLPPKPAAADEAWDLTLLTDEQFETFEELYAICASEKAPVPWRPPLFPKLSQRGLYLEEAMLTLDRIEAEALHRERKGQSPALPDEDLSLIRSALIWLLTGLPVSVEQVFAYIAENARFETRQEYANKEAARQFAAAAAPAAAPPAPAPVERRDNVVTALQFGSPRPQVPWVGDRPL